MKALKGFISVLLGFVMLISLTLFCGIIGVRTFLSGPTLGNIAMNMVEKNDKLDLSGVSDNFKFDSNELNDFFDEVSDYVSKEELYNEIGELASQMLQYSAGVTDKIDSSNFKKTMKEMAKKYEEKTGESVDFDKLEDEIDKAVSELEKESKQSEPPKEVETLFKGIYNQSYLIGCIIVFVVCAVLIVLVNMSIVPLFIHLFIIFLINGIGNGILGFGIKVLIPVEDESMEVILDSAFGIFGKMAIISFIIAAVSLVLFIILKVLTKKKKNITPQQPTYPEQ